jgi:hypothetical protein
MGSRQIEAVPAREQLRARQELSLFDVVRWINKLGLCNLLTHMVHSSNYEAPSRIT